MKATVSRVSIGGNLVSSDRVHEALQNQAPEERIIFKDDLTILSPRKILVRTQNGVSSMRLLGEDFTLPLRVEWHYGFSHEQCWLCPYLVNSCPYQVVPYRSILQELFELLNLRPIRVTLSYPVVLLHRQSWIPRTTVHYAGFAFEA